MPKPKEMQHPLWPDFVRWAEANGVNLEDSEDYLPWWECFFAGARAAVNA